MKVFSWSFEPLCVIGAGWLLLLLNMEIPLDIVRSFMSGNLQAELAKFRDNRDNRNLKMVEKLQEEGFQITAEDLYRLNPDTVVARPHIARYLVDSGQVKDLKTVFDKYIGDGCKCYVDRYKITPLQSVALIPQAGGLAILAHP